MSRNRRQVVDQNPVQKESIVTEESKTEEFDPAEHTAPEVVEELESASEEEKLRIAAEEQAGKNRKTVLEAAGVDENVRLDSSGRRLFPWEVAPQEQASGR